MAGQVASGWAPVMAQVLTIFPHRDRKVLRHQSRTCNSVRRISENHWELSTRETCPLLLRVPVLGLVQNSLHITSAGTEVYQTGNRAEERSHAHYKIGPLGWVQVRVEHYKIGPLYIISNAVTRLDSCSRRRPSCHSSRSCVRLPPGHRR